MIPLEHFQLSWHLIEDLCHLTRHQRLSYYLRDKALTDLIIEDFYQQMRVLARSIQHLAKMPLFRDSHPLSPPKFQSNLEYFIVYQLVFFPQFIPTLLHLPILFLSPPLIFLRILQIPVQLKDNLLFLVILPILICISDLEWCQAIFQDQTSFPLLSLIVKILFVVFFLVSKAFDHLFNWRTRFPFIIKFFDFLN